MLGQRVADVLAGLEYLRTRPDVDARHIGIYGEGHAGIVALLAAALDPQVTSVLLERTLLEFASVVEATDYDLPVPYFTFGFLQHFDLPQIIASLAPRPVWLLNPAGANKELLTRDAVRHRIAAVEASYAATPNAFRIVISPAPPQHAAMAWLATV